MKRFVEGMDRGQSTLLPECLEDWICEDNPVRVIDVFVGGLDLAELRFCGVDPEATGRPSILGADHLDAVADRGYFNSPEILACEQADITVTLPKPMTSGAKSDGRFGKQDFVYLPPEDVYLCPAGEKLAYRYTNEEDGKTLRRYWTTACPRCPLKSRCT